MQAFDIVEEFERRVAEYAGAKYGVAVHSCTDALMLSFWLRKLQHGITKVVLPKHTYVGVPYAALNAGLVCRFVDMDWSGAYRIEPGIVDAARRFHAGMYEEGTLYCLSFHWYKNLPIGRGGMILTNDETEAFMLKQMRYDGRTAGVAPDEDTFVLPGYHCYMAGDDAWQGIRLMENVKDYNEDIPWDNYPDLSKYPIFQRGYTW